MTLILCDFSLCVWKSNDTSPYMLVFLILKFFNFLKIFKFPKFIFFFKFPNVLYSWQEKKFVVVAVVCACWQQQIYPIILYTNTQMSLSAIWWQRTIFPFIHSSFSAYFLILRYWEIYGFFHFFFNRISNRKKKKKSKN